VSPRWVYQQVEQHDLPAYRLGARALRFDAEAVAAWLEARRIGDWRAAESCARPISRVPL
jgi:excisionase family DNA binding protein